jgi:hypothetical protein
MMDEGCRSRTMWAMNAANVAKEATASTIANVIEGSAPVAVRDRPSRTSTARQYTKEASRSARVACVRRSERKVRSTRG